MKRLLGILGILILLLAMVACVAHVRVPAIEIGLYQDEIIPMYDDSVQGWLIPGHYENRIWIAPVWTTDILFVHSHWNYYHGSHRLQLENHFNRHGGYKNYRNYHEKNYRGRRR